MVAVMTMMSIILLYACIEDANFILANEMRRASIEAVFSPSAAALPVRAERKILKARSQAEYIRVKDYGYLTERNGIDKLIALDMGMHMKVRNPIGLATDTNYDVALVSRAYVGRERKNEPMSEAEMKDGNAEPVFIFPQSGKKYHSRGCTYLRAAYVSATLNGDIRKRYTGCAVCHSRKAHNGALVYVFPNYGGAYHLPGCKAMDRHCIEIEKRIAIKRGYTPCEKCGG